MKHDAERVCPTTFNLRCRENLISIDVAHEYYENSCLSVSSMSFLFTKKCTLIY